MEKSFNCQNAFTLVELLVVIAVIGILAALLLPALERSKLSAQRSVCVNNLKQVGVAIKMYASDHDDTLPGASKPPNDYWKTNGIDIWNVYKSLVKNYVGLNGQSSPNDKAFVCPADIFFNFVKSNSYVAHGLHEDARSDFSSYNFNTGNLRTNDAGTGNLFPGIAGLKESSIVEPTKTILVGEMPAWIPFSWHNPQHTLQFENAMDQLNFVDGHIGYIPIYFDTSKTNSGTYSLASDPPASYEYKWSGY
jgi:prepilin-type N-terminal cleavage/methylation domain-containing protein